MNSIYFNHSHSSGVSGMEESACFAMMKAMFSNSSSENRSKLGSIRTGTRQCICPRWQMMAAGSRAMRRATHEHDKEDRD